MRRKTKKLRCVWTLGTRFFVSKVNGAAKILEDIKICSVFATEYIQIVETKKFA